MTDSVRPSDEEQAELAPAELTRAERHRVLVEWNATQADYPLDACLHELFGEQAERSPDVVAVELGAERLTYRELNRRANQLARHLAELGVGPRSLVGVSMERSLEMVVGLLGILKAGAAFVPLDPTFPPDRLRYMASDSGMQALLTLSHLRDAAPGSAGPVVCLDTDWPLVDRHSRDDLPRRALPDDLAYALYTSGTTGRPKGVMISHRAICNRLYRGQDTTPMAASDRMLQSTSLSFDVSVWEIFTPLLAGSRVVLPPPGAERDAALLVRLIAERGVTILSFVASMLEQILEQRGLEACRASLRRVYCGGEVVEPSLAKRFFSRLDAELYNVYGPTETAIDATLWVCRPDWDADSLPIGRPIANTQVYLLDSHQRPVAIGEDGELYIGGVSLARGYLGQPAMTAASFVCDPFGSEPGGRLFRTGDLARYRPDGNIEFRGRVDDQVQIRGQRIELGEIESRLKEHPAVRDVVVVYRAEDEGAGGRAERRLVAYAVAKENEPLTADDLRGHLSERVPRAMIPASFVLLDALPRTPSHKIDRQALPAPPRQRDVSSAFVAPDTPNEKRVAEIWSGVLGIDGIGAQDQFLELGGHSLLAMQIAARVEESFEIEVSVEDLFRCPSIAELAALIADRQQEGGHGAVTAIRPRERPERLPLAFSQERVWFLDQLVPGNIAYNAYLTVRFQGRLDVSALIATLSEIVRRHEILRTSFRSVEGRPVQRIEPPAPVELPVVDLSALSAEERRAEVERRVGEECGRPFDVTQAPLVRWTLLAEGPETHTLVQVEHHFVHDGWSLSVLLGEIRALYEAYSQGRPSPLEEPPLQFADFAVWQREWMESPAAKRQQAYWQERLAGAPPLLELPADHGRPKVPSFRGSRQIRELPPRLCQRLRALAQAEQSTLFMTLLAAFEILLLRHTQQTDIVVGSGVANRQLRESEGMLGMVLNNLVLRTDASGDPTFRQLLARVRETTLDAYANQQLPFEKIVDVLRPERSLSYNPLYQLMFSFHDAPMPSLSFPGLTAFIDYPHNGSAKFDSNIVIEPRAERRLGDAADPSGETVVVDWEYSLDLFEGATIARMLEHYQTLLEDIAGDPDKHLSQYRLATEAERQRTVVEWNDTRTDYPRDGCIHHRVEAWAEKTPEAVAVELRDQRLTYGELNRRANQLAHLLMARGVGPDRTVGICLERQPEMIVGLLAILKAGGAYVPLDAAYPESRLALMIADAEVSMLLTSSGLLSGLPELAAKAVCLDVDRDEISRQPTVDPTAGATAENVAYVMYTSGSTGRPKAVAVPHRAALRLLVDVSYCQLDARTTLLQMAPLSFDASTFEIWGALFHGGRCVQLPGRLPSTHELGRVLERHGVNTLWLTSSLFNVVIDEAPEILSGVEQLLIGGEALSVPHVRRALERLPSTRIINGYGPTEATTFACCYPIPRPLDDDVRSIPIGRPIANTQVYIVDPQLQPVPVGIPGELLIAGDGLARGYLNDAELTKRKFITHAFEGRPGARLYRTGDRVRYLPDGNIEFLGRFDDQIKLRGFRVELGEVEWALGQHPGVDDAVVLLRDDDAGEKALVAYLVASSEGLPDDDDLRAFLTARLPAYMLPSALVRMDAIPLSATGKVDRDALPLLGEEHREPAGAYVAPRSSEEGLLAGIFCEVLGKGQVGIHDDFFELGGQSLQLTRVLSRVRRELSVEVSLQALFEEPTVAGLASSIDRARISGLPGGAPETATIGRIPRQRGRRTSATGAESGARPSTASSDEGGGPDDL